MIVVIEGHIFVPLETSTDTIPHDPTKIGHERDLQWIEKSSPEWSIWGVSQIDMI